MNLLISLNIRCTKSLPVLCNVVKEKSVHTSQYGVLFRFFFYFTSFTPLFVCFSVFESSPLTSLPFSSPKPGIAAQIQNVAEERQAGRSVLWAFLSGRVLWVEKHFSLIFPLLPPLHPLLSNIIITIPSTRSRFQWPNHCEGSLVDKNRKWTQTMN